MKMLSSRHGANFDPVGVRKAKGYDVPLTFLTDMQKRENMLKKINSRKSAFPRVRDYM